MTEATTKTNTQANTYYSKTSYISNQGLRVVEAKFEGNLAVFTLVKTGREIFRATWSIKPAEAYQAFRAYCRRNDKEAWFAMMPDPRFCLPHERPQPGYWDEKRGWLTYAENAAAARKRASK